MVTLHSLLPAWQLSHQRILLRADLNVPLRDNTIIDDYRLVSLQPTLDFLLRNNNTLFLLTHRGRPKNNEPALSTALLMPWFSERGYAIYFAPTIEQARNTQWPEKSLVLLENLRFFPGEKSHDPAFAQQLAQLGDYYVNDAFGTLHRPDTSIACLPRLFDVNKRTIGFLIEKELTILNKLISKPRHPFVLVIGGGKVEDKIPLIKTLLPLTDYILLCPAIVFSFLKASGKETGKSLVADDQLPACTMLLERARVHHTRIEFPSDYYGAYQTFDGVLRSEPFAADNFPNDIVGISIGPITCARYQTIIQQAGTVLMNGLMGDSKRPETLKSAQALMQAMGNCVGETIIAGGDSVALARTAGLASQITYLSTGGGATLAYLSNEPLPGLEAFLKNGTKT